MAVVDAPPRRPLLPRLDMTERRLGRYLLDRQIATGGMAEIWLARQDGVAGFEKDIVIKRILPHMAKDQKFVEMFLDEARLAARLTHPNIVQIFDLGEADGDYFIAMEYIDGVDLSDVIERARKHQTEVPPAVAAKLVAYACQALDYAHHFREKDGTPVELVHRDISPQNILLSRDGVVKVVDFGVAKAATSQHKTQTGAVKGKLSYMSPEQISGKKIDGRSDLFALGIVLYELVTSQRPFGHESELLAITAILNEQPAAPRALATGVPPELESIIFRALEKDPDARFASAREMQMALDAVLHEMGALLSARDLAEYLEDLFSDAPTHAVGQLPSLAATAVGAHQADLRRAVVTVPQHPSATTRPGASAATAPAEPMDATGVRLKGALADASANRSAVDEPARERSRAGLVLAVIAALALVAVAAWGVASIVGPGADPSEAVVANDDADPAPDASVDVADLVVPPDDAAPSAEATALADAVSDTSTPQATSDPLEDTTLEDNAALVAALQPEIGTSGTAPELDAERETELAADRLPPEPDATQSAAPEAPTAEVPLPTNTPDVAAAPTPAPRASNGTLRVRQSGGGRVTLYVNGESQGVRLGTRTFPLSPGRHRVRAEDADGTVLLNETVTIVAGETYDLRVR